MHIIAGKHVAEKCFFKDQLVHYSCLDVGGFPGLVCNMETMV